MTEETSRKKRTMITAEKINVAKKLLEQEKKVSEIGYLLDLSRVATSRLIAKIQSGEYQNLNEFKTSGQKKSLKKISHAQMKILIADMFVIDSTFTQKAIVERLSQCNIVVSQSTVSRVLHDMEYTRKRLSKIPSERNSDRVLNLRRIYGQEISLIADENILYLDESGFNMHVNKNYGYSPKNSKAYKIVPGNRGRNVSLMCVISNTGIVASELIDGSYNTQLFLAFLQTKLLPRLTERNYTIIMDNCKFHHSSAVNEYCISNSISIRYLPPYSPQLNPIEEFFGCLKARYTNILPNVVSIQQMKERIDGILQLNDIATSGFYRNTRRYIEQAIARVHFI